MPSAAESVPFWSFLCGVVVASTASPVTLSPSLPLRTGRVPPLFASIAGFSCCDVKRSSRTPFGYDCVSTIRTTHDEIGPTATGLPVDELALIRLIVNSHVPESPGTRYGFSLSGTYSRPSLALTPSISLKVAVASTPTSPIRAIGTYTKRASVTRATAVGSAPAAAGAAGGGEGGGVGGTG